MDAVDDFRNVLLVVQVGELEDEALGSCFSIYTLNLHPKIYGPQADQLPAQS